MARRKPDLKLPAHRPSIPIDWEMVDKYLEAGCYGTEIAGVIGCHPETIYERCIQEKGMCFSSYSAQKKSKGDALLRDKQFQKALKGDGDNTMLIFLGKVRMNQQENGAQAQAFDGKLAEILDVLKEAKETEKEKPE